jgi:tight adherence protein C
MTIFLILAATFAAVCLMTYGALTLRAQKLALSHRFKKPKAEADPFVSLRKKERQTKVKNRLMEWISSFGRLAMKDKGGDASLSDLRLTLIKAGFRHSSAAAAFFGIRVLLAMFLPAVSLFVFWLKGQPLNMNVMVAALLCGIGYYIPKYVLKFLAKQRMDRIDRTLPDVLDLMIVSMEAGLSLQATLNRVAEEIKRLSKDFHRELSIANAELRAGIPRDVALKNLAERTGVPSVKSLVALMLQSEKMGASITQSLRNHATFVRVQRAQRAEEIAAKMPVKIVFPTLFCIFPSIFIVILGPAAISIYRNLVSQ